ncbi:MAG: TonB-dependent receptor [Candidatus Competibacter sp.]
MCGFIQHLPLTFNKSRWVGAPLGLLGLVFVLGVVSRLAFAEHTSVDLTRFSLEELMQVEVYSASKFGQKASEAPSAVTVITADDIKTYGYRTLADILRSLPGVYVSYDRNYSSVGVRGFGRPGDYNDHLLFLIDGYRINDNIYDMAPVDTDSIVDVDLIERVEFLPAGPATALYGNNAFFGVVNITTKRGRDIGGVELAGSVASAETNRGRATFGRKLSNGSELLLSATTYDSQGRNLYFPEFDDPLTHNGVAVGLDYDTASQFFGKLSFEDWTLELAHANRDKGVPTASYGQDFNDPRSRTEDQRTFVSLGYRAAWNTHLDVQGHLLYGTYDYHGDYIYEGINLPDQATGRWWNADLQFTNTAFDSHKLAFGAEYQRDLQQNQAAFDETGTATFDSRMSGDRWGLYALDEFALIDRTNLSIGIRYDRTANGDDSIDPRVGLVYQWDTQTTLKLLYSTAFRSPNAYELYYASDYLPNPTLRSETIKTYELILDKRLDESTRFNASVYHYDINDLIDLTTDPDSGLLTFRNLSNVEANGLTVEVVRHWTNGARLRASYSWQLAEDETGGWLDNSPRHLAKVNWSQPFFGDIWRAGLELQYIGKRRGTQGNEVADALVANLNLLGQPFGKNLDVALGVYNLFDQDYADPGAEEHLQTEILQDGRSWRLKLDYRF